MPWAEAPAAQARAQAAARTAMTIDAAPRGKTAELCLSMLAQPSGRG
jgi:hypothetical protein